MQSLQNEPLSSFFNQAQEKRTAQIEGREIHCSSLLHKLNFRSSKEYTINLYRGCSHGCVYCYAPSLIHDERSWGRYVDVKVNAHRVLERELRTSVKDIVFVSSASDPYQPLEARYGITRKCLLVLERFDFPTLVLTRSPLVLRDLDLLLKFRWVRVGFSISSVSDSPLYEPGVPRLEERIRAIEKLSKAGIKTWVSLAPIIPKLQTVDYNWLFRRLRGAGISAISIGLLRFQGYEDSRKMFEERTGKESESVLIGGSEVIEEVIDSAEKAGLDTTCSSLSWTMEARDLSMESFI